MFIISALGVTGWAVCIAGTGKWLKPVAATNTPMRLTLRYRKELIMIIFDVSNGGITARLMNEVTKKDGGVFLNGKMVPFRNPNSLNEGVITMEAANRIIMKATKMVELKGGDKTWQQ